MPGDIRPRTVPVASSRSNRPTSVRCSRSSAPPASESLSPSFHPSSMLPKPRGGYAMLFDYSNAPPPRNIELIPDGTVATINTHLRPRGAGEGGLLKRSRDGGCEMLDVEFTVVDGLYKGRKFWEYFLVNGTTDGHAQAVEISNGRLKAILDSALGLKPDDM